MEVLVGVPRMRQALEFSFSRCTTVDTSPFLFSRCVPSPFDYSDGILAQLIMLALALCLTRLREGSAYRDVVQPAVSRAHGQLRGERVREAAVALARRLHREWQAQHERDLEAHSEVTATLQRIKAWRLAPGSSVVAALARARPHPPADVRVEVHSRNIARVRFRSVLASAEQAWTAVPPSQGAESAVPSPARVPCARPHRDSGRGVHRLADVPCLRQGAGQ